MASTFNQAFPELQAIAPVLAGSQKPQPSVLNSLRRQQLVHLAEAYGLDVPKDGTKEELLEALRPMEKKGVFQQPCRDPLALWFASKTPDELVDMRVKGQAFPTREQLPLREAPPEPLDPNSFKGLQQRLAQAGINSFGMTKKDMLEALMKDDIGLNKPPPVGS